MYGKVRYFVFLSLEQHFFFHLFLDLHFVVSYCVALIYKKKYIIMYINILKEKINT